MTAGNIEKMQNEFKSPCAGTVAKLYVEEGVTVETGAKLVEVTALPPDHP